MEAIIENGTAKLPPIDDFIHLRNYGYDYKKPAEDRHAALRSAAKATDLLLVLRRLNFIRNKRHNDAANTVISADVEYLKKLYAIEKDLHGPSHGSYLERHEIDKIGGKKKRVLLPRLDNDIIHLSNYGYAYEKAPHKRHKALRAAARDTDILLVLRRLNYLRNIQSKKYNLAAKSAMSADVEYLKKLYAKYRKSHGPSHGSYPDRMKGGDDSETDSESNININMVELPSGNIISKIEESHTCINNECEHYIKVYEKHQYENSEIIFRNIEMTDIDNLIDFMTNHHIESNRDILIADINHNQYIGIFVENKLMGIMKYSANKSDVKILIFVVDKPYGTTFMKFLDKFFTKNNFESIESELSVDNDNIRYINIMQENGMKIDKIINDKMFMKKVI